MDAPITEREQEHQAQAVPPPAATEQLVTSPEDDESPEAIFLRAISEIATQPLAGRDKTPQERRVLLFILLSFLSFVGGSVLAVATYPTVTITLTPVTKSVVLTTRLNVQTRSLAPVTASNTETLATTGTGHQDATEAKGTLTFYNGSLSPQSVSAGSIFTGADGTRVQIDATVTIPANNPPQDGTAWAAARSVTYGSKGNIAALDIDVAITGDLVVKNLYAFQGGRDARTYQAVARSDIDAATATLKTALHQRIPRAFSVRPGEGVYPTRCLFKATPNHKAGQEAKFVTVQAFETCTAVAYNQDELEQKATAAFTAQTTPGANYMLVGTVTPSISSGSPVIVEIRGIWVYSLPEDYEQFLAQQIAGDSPRQAQAYLLQTGLITRATVPYPLPKDPQHIKFLVLFGD